MSRGAGGGPSVARWDTPAGTAINTQLLTFVVGWASQTPPPPPSGPAAQQHPGQGQESQSSGCSEMEGYNILRAAFFNCPSTALQPFGNRQHRPDNCFSNRQKPLLPVL